MNGVIYGFGDFSYEMIYSITGYCINPWLTLGSTLICSVFSVTAAGSVGEIYTILTFSIMFSVSMMQSALNFVGIEVGMGDAKRAKKMSNLIILEGLIVLSIVCLLL